MLDSLLVNLRSAFAAAILANEFSSCLLNGAWNIPWNSYKTVK